MAQYEPTAEAISQSVDEAVKEGGLSQSTAAIIETLVASGAAVVAAEGTVSSSDVQGADAVLISGGSEVNATMNTAETLWVGEGASGQATMQAQNPVTADLTNVDGLKLTIENNANNTVNVFGGSGSVETGDGNDDINIDGAFTGEVKTGSGDLNLSLSESAQRNAEISVDAGDGFDVLTLIGNAVKHTFTFEAGKFHMASAGVEMEGIQVVATDANSDGSIDLTHDHITVLAENHHDSTVAKLYKVALGREAIDGTDGWSADGKGDTLGGINWWMNEFEKQADNDGSIDHLVHAFLNSDEFHKLYDGVSNTKYVNTLLENAGATDTLDAETYISALKSGAMDRADVAYSIASSVEVLGVDGQVYVVEGFTDGNA